MGKEEKDERRSIISINILVIINSFWGSAIWILADLRELCTLQDFTHISIPLQFITLLLPRSQVTAYKAKACLVQ